MKRVLVSTLVICLLMSTVALAKGSKKSKAPTRSADVVQLQPVEAEVSATAGQRVEFAVKFDILKTWHLYAHGDSNFIGIDLYGADGFPLTELKAEYPHAHPGVFMGDKVMMHEGQDVIKASALVPADLAKGKHKLDLALTVQACDDKSCLRPDEVPVSLTLTVK